MNFYEGKDILVTGGAGSIGSQIVKELTKFNPKRIRILDQNETAQFFLQQSLREHENIRYFIGSITNKEKVRWAMKGVDIVFHCAALKHVPSCEYNPSEAVLTNIIGLMHTIDAAKEHDIEKFIYISTDKAVNPSNIMGTSKLLGEKLVNNASSGETKTKFATVRFGNVLDSNGSVIPLFKKQVKEEENITVTHKDMTRFFMTIKSAAKLVLETAQQTNGRQTFILKMPAFRIIDLAEVLAEELPKKYYKPKPNVNIIGVRPGEKLHEVLLTEEEASIINETEHSLVLNQQLITPHCISLTEPKNNVDKSKYDSSKANLLTKDQIKDMLASEKII
jgi:UDP-N-acetylglucosamine 4,6-dehydratase/5-epimerase